MRGAGGTFSYGRVGARAPARAGPPAMLAAFRDLVRDVASYPVPVAALVEGRCLGGAFELVARVPPRLRDPSAVFGCPEIKLGVVPPVLAVLGPTRLGGALAERLLLTGADLDAATARTRAGLLAGSSPPACDPEAWVLDWYRKTLAPLSAFVAARGGARRARGSGLLAAPRRAARRRRGAATSSGSCRATTATRGSRRSSRSARRSGRTHDRASAVAATRARRHPGGGRARHRARRLPRHVHARPGAGDRDAGSASFYATSPRRRTSSSPCSPRPSTRSSRARSGRVGARGRSGASGSTRSS